MQGQQVARLLAAQKQGLSDTRDAVCVDVDYVTRLATVNVGGSVQVMAWAAAAPWPGDRVRVFTLGQKPVCVVSHGSPQGTVSSADSSQAVVVGDDGVTYTYPYRVGDALAPGDRVRLDHAGRFVAGEYTAEPPGSEYETPAAPPSSGTFSRTFYPTDSGNYRFGVYQTQFAEVSANRAAYYWYGTQIASTIPDAATITKAQLRLVEVWDELPTVPSRLGTHAQASSVHTSSAPAISGALELTGGGTINVATYATALKTGAAYGFGFPAGYGWRRFDSGARSGALYVEWTL